MIFADFNSHAHVERDENRLSAPFDVNISTHTLTWSVTGMEDTADEPVNISTHTLTWSVTAVWRAAGVTPAISTHTLTWSVTTEADSTAQHGKFQLTRSRGA